MELKAKLDKPYSKAQRQEFIVEQNHNNGYELRETETALEAWGYSAEERQEQAEEKRRAEIMAQLDALDLKCIRALRAISAGTGTEADTERLAELEAQAEELRKKL
ncbi:MAG: hypothetical protein J6Z08_00630 [Elusimicrobiales bacterium]|nr:hypothetical protein [Elusimicrobiales bacterium]